MNMRVGNQDMAGFMQPSDFDTLMGYGQGRNLYNTAAYDVPGVALNPAFTTLPGATPPGSTGGFGLDSMLGPNGWGGLALGAAQGLMGGYMGLQQLGMAKKSFKENQRQFNLNFDAQRRTTNAALADRQRARLASNPGAYQSEYDYMNQYGVK